MKKGIVFSVAAVKGGAGKSTLSIMVANYLAFVEKLKIVVIDGDPQNTIHSLRKDEELISDEGIERYTIKSYLGDDIPPIVDFYKEKYDVIILDLAGTIMGDTQLVNYNLVERGIVPFNCSSVAKKSLDQMGKYFHKDILPYKKDTDTKIRIMFNNISPVTTLYKNFNALHKIDKNTVLKSIKQFAETEEYLSEYTLPFELLGEDATINHAPSALAGRMSSLNGKKSNELIDRHQKQLETIHQFIIS